jgi:hypothetical protein
MNLFVFDIATHKVQVSKEFWIYVATFVPLTMLTLGVWFVLFRSAKQRRERRDKGIHMAHIPVQQRHFVANNCEIAAKSLASASCLMTDVELSRSPRQ